MDSTNQPDELIRVNRQLIAQILEKERQAAALRLVNRELTLQNEENARCAVDLMIANKELVVQNEEKEKRAAELVVANKELVFQNEEKAKRADELEEAERYLKDYIQGLEEMMFMTSHRVRQPICNILGIAGNLQSMVNSHGELQRSVTHLEVSALALDAFTRELTIFMRDLEQKGKHKIDSVI